MVNAVYGRFFYGHNISRHNFTIRSSIKTKCNHKYLSSPFNKGKMIWNNREEKVQKIDNMYRSYKDHK